MSAETNIRTYGSFILLYITVIPALVKAISMDSFPSCLKTYYKYAVHDVPALCEVRPLWGVICM